MSKFLNKLKKVANNPYAFVANEEDNIYSIKEYCDTGCFILNAAISGSIYGGIGLGKRIQFAGPSSSAKSYITTFCAKAFLDKYPESVLIAFETEGSTITDMLKTHNIDPSRVLIFPVSTIEECRTQCFNLLDEIIENNKEKENPDRFIFLIDSLGNLTTSNELKQVKEGSDSKDMTRQSLLRSFGRTSSLKFSLAQVPLLVVNHSYETMSQYTGTQVSGGGGPIYMSDVILVPTKGKEKEGTNHVGGKFGLGIYKSRFTKEGKRIYIIIHFDKGLYKYSDLEDWAKTLNVFGKEGNSYILPDGQKVKTTTFRKKFKEYANDINMNAIDEAIQKEFKFGNVCEETFEEIEDDE